IPFTAIVASNDMMALGAIQALRELNISVPEEVEVIGCDDIPFSSLIQPTLTTMRIPLEKFGRQVASIMMDLIAGNPVSDKNIRLEAELILRGSTRRTKQETKGT
ncbi:MAG: substrate-binding domain-containing protein, partial [Candidatus Faecousia sp.]|nr:substrate-binding domain-containing protein [Candidatus Faecousia sp.]